jgi:hypothetical protein
VRKEKKKEIKKRGKKVPVSASKRRQSVSGESDGWTAAEQGN